VKKNHSHPELVSNSTAVTKNAISDLNLDLMGNDLGEEKKEKVHLESSLLPPSDSCNKNFWKILTGNFPD